MIDKYFSLDGSTPIIETPLVSYADEIIPSILIYADASSTSEFFFYIDD